MTQHGRPDLNKDLAGRLADAALEHAAATGESDMAVGDMELLLRAALDVVQDEQRRALFQSESVRELLEIPEFAPIASGLREVKQDRARIVEVLAEKGDLTSGALTVLTTLVKTIEATGGCIRDARGYACPEGDRDRVDLGDVYLSACSVLGREPQITDEDADSEA